MSKDFWLEHATKFELGECPFQKRKLVIEARDQLDESRKWTIKVDEWCLGKDGEWHYEWLPSSRTEEFIELTRFRSPEQAYNFYKLLVKETKKLYLP